MPSSDLYHLNERGKYFQALVWVASLYDEDLASLRYRPCFVPPDEAEKMKKLVSDCVAGGKRVNGDG